MLSVVCESVSVCAHTFRHLLMNAYKISVPKHFYVGNKCAPPKTKNLDYPNWLQSLQITFALAHSDSFYLTLARKSVFCSIDINQNFETTEIFYYRICSRNANNKIFDSMIKSHFFSSSLSLPLSIVFVSFLFKLLFFIIKLHFAIGINAFTHHRNGHVIKNGKTYNQYFSSNYCSIRLMLAESFIKYDSNS